MPIDSKDDIHKQAKQFVEHLHSVGEHIDCEPDSFPIDLPLWFDLDLFQQGQKFYHKHIFAMYFAKFSGLITILAVPSILEVLRFTKMSSTSETSFKRYVATILHMHQWYTSDITDRQSNLWKSLKIVHFLHKNASRRSRKACNGQITQKDMALTQFGFVGYQLIRSSKIGIHSATDDEFLAFTHVWRTIGYLLGIRDEFNLCRNTITETKAIFQLILNEVFKPKIQENNSHFLHMFHALVDGMWSFNPILKPNVFIHIIYDLCEIEPFKRTLLNEMSLIDRLIYWFMNFVLQYLLRLSIFRIGYNFQKYVSLFLIEHFPFLAFYRFGYRNSFVHIYKYNK